MGAVSLAAPVYVAEVASSERRGALGSGFQLLVAFGVFVAYGLGALISWSWLAVAGAMLAFLHALLLLIVPETPRWLLGRQDRQVNALCCPERILTSGFGPQFCQSFVTCD
jgi:MFS family permease